MTVGFYVYIGQNYIFEYFNSKISKLLKKNIWKKKYLKNSPIFCGPAKPLRGDILTNSCELIFLSQSGNVGTNLFVWGCANMGKVLKPPENP